MSFVSLQEICYTKLAVIFSTQKDMEKHMTKQKNGLVQAESGLRDLRDSIFALPLPENVKNRLMHIMERVAYEIIVFTTKSSLNYPESQFSLAEDIQWHIGGLINEKSTYKCYFGKKPNTLLNFECFCIISSEKELQELWPKVRSEIQQLKLNNLLVSFWVHKLQDNLNDFIGGYGRFIVGFEADKSIHYNMIKYCLNLNFKSALEYFFNCLSVSEKQLLTDENHSLLEISIFKKVLKTPRQENFKFICSFLEQPIADKSYFELILKDMPVEGFMEFLNYLLRNVNIFGNMHYNILKRIFAKLNVEKKSAVLSNLDFYVLNLLAKGHFETFEFSFKNAKEILRHQIWRRLKEGKGIGIFYTISKNNQRHLLDKLILNLTEDDQELIFYLKKVLDDL